MRSAVLPWELLAALSSLLPTWLKDQGVVSSPPAGSIDGVVRLDGATGANLGLFASGFGVNGDLLFGPDGSLYVASSFNNGVVRFDGTTGAFMDLFASGGGLDTPSRIAFGPAGDLFVSSQFNNVVLRFNGATGAFIGVFASNGGLQSPAGLAFDQMEICTSRVLTLARSFATTGHRRIHQRFCERWVDQSPELRFSSDGSLYVASIWSDEVRHYGVDGAFTGAFVNAGAGLNVPIDLLFTAEPAPVPEPASLTLILVGVGSIVALRSPRDEDLPPHKLNSSEHAKARSGMLVAISYCRVTG